ncbi:hypothetical protein [Streptosporangium lutulentum]|uniref:Uncharacterized protein n=1 Tax=Streptosporangium lutulentum TaxID=1461250 RepID=A0ABT9QHS9_9ACTN|nr:hypothetical protein [Streptosporangium lutulentum]MDP9846247.1 hypothetical protein [Streptosporangium lutulentum]
MSTPEEADARVRGPYRFVPGMDGGSEGGRTATLFVLLPAGGRLLAVDRTLTRA